ncbi:MAG: S-layer homology domain-containing protein [Clostridia bacterium]|nr:S-layer homology domain-containing protein [Clostridia bacterium]
MRSKRILSTILTICIFLSLLVPAKATGLTSSEKADVLKSLAVFGSSNLEAQVKRYEAAIYAVRVLGKEAYVKENADTLKQTKYTDVDSKQAYAPYIGYCEGAGLIKDSSAGKFNPDKNITEKAFLNIILGTMGYIYKTDYTISNIYSKAYDIGLYTDSSYKTKTADNTNFKKSDVVNILYNALSKNKKGTKIRLIQNLVSEKVISKETAISTGLLSDSVLTAIEKVMVLDQTNIFVKINEPIQNLTINNIKIYKTGKPDKVLTFTIKSQGSDGSFVLNTGAQEALESYTIEMINIKDIEGNEAGTLTSTFEGVQGSEIKSDFFRISKVMPISKDCINIYFTHPVNINSQVASSYEIWEGEKLFVKGSSQTIAVRTIPETENAVSLYLNRTSFVKDSIYVLKINGNLTSAYGVKINDGSGDSVKFKGTDSIINSSSGNNSPSELTLSNISLVDNQTMRLEFNMEISPTLAKQLLNYYITDSNGVQLTVKQAALATETGKKDRIVFVSINGVFTQGASYSLTIDYMTDVTRQYIIDGKKYPFTASYPGKVNMLINGITGIDGNTLKITFNKALDKESAENISNYLITGINHTNYSAVPVKAIYDPVADPNSVKLYLVSTNPMQKDKVYIVSVMSTLKDNIGNSLSGRLQGVLTCTNGTVTKPAIKEAVIISSDSIRVSFNKEVLIEKQTILTSNYILQYNDGRDTVVKVPIGICVINETTFILKFDSLDFNTAYKLSCVNIKDFTGATSDAQSFKDVTMGSK